MKKYVEIKRVEVEAEPMTMGEAFKRNLLPVFKVPHRNEQDNAGLYVKYSDGHESWMSEESFENTFVSVDTAFDRLIIERRDLADKLAKLCLFVESPKFEETVKDENHRRLLLAQREHMGEYLNILNQRIKLFKE